jgi:hypothetical protein
MTGLDFDAQLSYTSVKLKEMALIRLTVLQYTAHTCSKAS